MLSKLSNSKVLIPAMIIVAVAAAGAGFYISLKQSQQARQTRPAIEGLFWPNPKQIKSFETIDQTGKLFGLEQLQNRWSFVFFGYTHCPDICPITLSVMAEMYKNLDDKNNVQIIFVSVDPERDTTNKLAQYVTYFNEDFIGLGGTIGQVNSLTKQIGVAFFHNIEEDSENYLVDHSASIFLIDPKARMVGKISPPHQAEQITQQFKQIKDYIDAQN